MIKIEKFNNYLLRSMFKIIINVILQVGAGSPGVPVRGTGGGGMVSSTGGPGSVGAPGTAGGNGQGPGAMAGNGPRSQGPPPPYHQTTRSASVPIAIQSPNPASPNNPTSNLSLPSPRASSALNSPADCNRQFQLGGNTAPGSGQRPAGPGASSGAGGQLPGQSPTSQDSPNPAAVNASTTATRLNHSNPGTPVSHGHLAALSPSGTPQKDPSSLDFPVNQTTNGMLIFSNYTFLLIIC